MPAKLLKRNRCKLDLSSELKRCLHINMYELPHCTWDIRYELVLFVSIAIINDTRDIASIGGVLSCDSDEWHIEIRDPLTFTILSAAIGRKKRMSRLFSAQMRSRAWYSWRTIIGMGQFLCFGFCVIFLLRFLEQCQMPLNAYTLWLIWQLSYQQF